MQSFRFLLALVRGVGAGALVLLLASPCCAGGIGLLGWLSARAAPGITGVAIVSVAASLIGTSVCLITYSVRKRLGTLGSEERVSSLPVVTVIITITFMLFTALLTVSGLGVQQLEVLRQTSHGVLADQFLLSAHFLSFPKALDEQSELYTRNTPASPHPLEAISDAGAGLGLVPMALAVAVFVTFILSLAGAGAVSVGTGRETTDRATTWILVVSAIMGIGTSIVSYLKLNTVAEAIAMVHVSNQEAVARAKMLDLYNGHYRDVAHGVLVPNRTISEYAAQLDAIDLSRCPTAFRPAFKAFVQAWADLGKYVEENSGLPGMTRAFATGGTSLLEFWFDKVPAKVEAIRAADRKLAAWEASDR